MQNLLPPINENLYIGVNNRLPSHLLPRGVFQQLNNAIIDNNAIVKRPGTSLLTTTAGAFSILGGTPFEPAGGTDCVIICRTGASNAQLYRSTGGTFSAIGSANLDNSAQMNFVQASNRLFGFNGIEVVDVASDGTTVTRNRAGVPSGAFGFWFHNYLFVGGVTANPNRLYWSALGDPTTFDSSDYVDVNANDGDALTGLNILNDELIVFKNYSTWSISGWSGTSFDTTTRAGQNTQNKAVGVGTPSHQSIIGVGRDLYYLSYSGGTPHFRSFNQTTFSRTIEQGIISYEIESTMEGLNLSQLSKCAGIYDGRYIYWALPNSGSSTNNIIVVLDPDKTYKTTQGGMRSWVTWSGITPQQWLTSSVSGRARTYFTNATATAVVYLLNSAVSTDNGTAITMTVRTRDFMFHPAKESKWKYLYIKYASGVAGSLAIYGRVDQAVDFALQETLSTQGGSPGLGPTGTFTLGTSVLGGSTITTERVDLEHLTGQLFGAQIIESSTNGCTIYDMQFLGLLKGYRAA